MARHLLLAATVVTALGLAACGPQGTAPIGAVPTTTVAVVRTDIVSRLQMAGTLTYAGSYTVINQAGLGVLTSLPAPGAVIARGQVLYRVDNRPISLFYGDPAWRHLAVGVADGPDIRALQMNLSALGFVSSGLRIDTHFDRVTAAAVRRWQASLGIAQTGAVNLSDIIYMPGAIRIGTVHATAGMFAQPGAPLIEATSTQHTVLLALDVTRESLVKRGDPVVVTMPDGKTNAAGSITGIGTVAVAQAGDNGGSSSGPQRSTLTLTISLADPNAGGSLDQAPVNVNITDDTHRGVLAVPVMALLAQPGGSYAVEVVDGTVRRPVAVTTGLFDDRGMVEVGGPELREGMWVEVPRT